MKDTEFIEKIRELSKLPDFVIAKEDEQFAKDFKSDELEFLGRVVNHRYLISELLTQYDQENISEKVV